MFFITTDNAEAQSGKLTNNFDKDKVQKELDLQREVTESFGQTVTQTSAMIADKLSEESRKKKYEAAVELENAQNALKENDSETNRTWEEQAQANFDTANREAKEWETGGSQRRVLDSALNVVSTFLAGRPATEVVASGLSPTINHQIKEMTTDKDGNVNTPVNLMAHAIWGGIEAYAGNRNAAAGAAGAVAGEAAANAISHLLYEKSPDKLTQEEKLTVSTLSQAAASIAGGTLANNADGAIIAAKTAKDAVENNAFNSIADNSHPSDERREYIKMYSKVYFNGDEDKAAEFVEGMEIAEAKGQMDTVKEGVETVKAIASMKFDEFLDTALNVIENPDKVVESVVISLNEWDDLYVKALKENPRLAGEMLGYRQGNLKGIPTGGVVLTGSGLVLAKSMVELKKLGANAAGFATHQVRRVINHTTLNKVINEVDNVAVSTDKGFINATKVCAASCEIKATSKAEQLLIDDIVKNGDIKGSKTETLIHDLAKRSGYEPLNGGKYGSNNGFDHVLLGKDGSVIIIDSKQIKNNGSIQVSSKAAGNTNQLSDRWVNAVVGKLPENDPTRVAIENAKLTAKPIKTIIAGVDKSNGKVVLLPVKIPNKN